MKVVLFGGSGFLGSHVADELTARGYEVTIFDTEVSPYLQENQQMVVGDIRDADLVASTLKGAKYVYNFAGIADIVHAEQDPVQTMEVNIIGNARLLHAARDAKVERFIFASSVYVYSDLASFYRVSKQSCELLIEEYQRQFGLDFTILRYGSLYGRRANKFNFIAQIVQQAITKGKIERRGIGEEVRDYIHVLDAARCSVDILHKQFCNQHVIITGTQTMKVNHVLEIIREIFNNKITVEYSPEQDEGVRYKLTPYVFKPKLAKKLVLNHYHDFGQGVLDVVHDIYEQEQERGKAVIEIQEDSLK